MSAAKQEWARMWPLPLVAMIGITGSASVGYSASVFMEPITREFGWTRAEFFSAVTMQMIAGMLIIPFVGLLIDRLGSRVLAIVGTVTFVMSFSALGLANGALWQWFLLAGLQIIGAALITQPVWVKPVIGQFDASRGLAMAIALSGNGVANTIWPFIAAALIEWVGWRAAYMSIALGWAAVSLPLTLLFFRDGRRVKGAATVAANSPAARPPLLPTVLSAPFLFLTASGALFSCAVFGLTLHLVPLLRGAGVTTVTAGAIAGLAGISAVIGRLGTGYLLDRLPTRLVGIIVFVLPIIVCSLLWTGAGAVPLYMLAAILLGLAAGAEIDVVTFIASRQFDQRIFGSIYAVVIASFGGAASLGPLLAGALFDARGNYDVFLLCAASLSAIGAMLMAMVAIQPAQSRTPNNLDQIPVPADAKS
ncbi:MFS transporter [Sphingobium tyrosinilyticum]|uniref:MFS transporter n=1 Tax=Sphingobium tyrosinilyticum TaxID=2715436 RepID=A0ABV9F1S6_9SPHN